MYNAEDAGVIFNTRKNWKHPDRGAIFNTRDRVNRLTARVSFLVPIDVESRQTRGTIFNTHSIWYYAGDAGAIFNTQVACATLRMWVRFLTPANVLRVTYTGIIFSTRVGVKNRTSTRCATCYMGTKMQRAESREYKVICTTTSHG